MQKGFATVNLLVILVLISLVFVGVYYLGKFNSPSQNSTYHPRPTSTPPIFIENNISPTPPPLEKNQPIQSNSSDQTVDTSNWKTYTNKTFNYSLKYPSNWYIHEYNSDYFKPTAYEPNPPLDVVFIDPIFKFDNSFPFDVGGFDFAIFVSDKNNKSAQYAIDHPGDGVTLTNITFAGVNATKWEEAGSIYFFNGNYFYTINDGTFLGDAQNKDYAHVILSSFKFIN